jgi:tellurite resistance protein
MQFFEDWFSKRPRSSSGEHPNSSKSSHDSSDYFSTDSSRDKILDGLRLWLKYVDTEGQASERWVQVYRIECRQFADYLVAYCELRDDIRTFRLDRIVELADPDGELHVPQDFFAPYISRPSRQSTEADKHTPFGRALHVVDRLGDEMRLLAFVAEADGRFANKEANTVMRIVELRANDLGINLKKAELADLRRWLKSQKPDALTMTAAVSRMAMTGFSGNYDEIWSLVEIVAESDGKLDPREIVTLDKIKEAIAAEFRIASA